MMELELNGIIIRSVHQQNPVLIEYTLTPSGNQMIDVIFAMIAWD